MRSKLLFVVILFSLFTPATATAQTVIWEGEHNLGNWNANQDLAWGRYDWSQVCAGSTLTFYYTKNAGTSSWNITIGVAGNGWAALNSNSSSSLTGSATQWSLKLTASDVKTLAEKSGMIINGLNITLTRVTLTTPSVTVTPVSDGYLTHYNGESYNLMAPGGVKVYTVTGSRADGLLLHEVADGIIPSKQGAVLKARSGEAFKLTGTGTASTEDFDGNILRGVARSTRISAISGLTTEDYIFVLGSDPSQGTGFVPLAVGETLAKNQCYIDLGTVGAEDAFVGFDIYSVRVELGEYAQVVMNVLQQLYGQKMISGTMANVDWNIDEAKNVYRWTGKYPALNVFDFIHADASKDVNPNGWLDYSDISVPRAWWRAGGLVGCMWHWGMTTNDGSGLTCTPGTDANKTSFDCSKITDPSSEEYVCMVKDMDQIAKYLKKLRAAGIPVLWRPLHEAGGRWFWWGAQGPKAFKQLWRFMHDRYTNHHKLNNLIWVCNIGEGEMDWYPGDDYVDIVAMDNYHVTVEKTLPTWQFYRSQYPDKLAAMAECGDNPQGTCPMASVADWWNADIRWSWFTTWYDSQYNAGKTDAHLHVTPEWWQNAVAQDFVVTRDEMKEIINEVKTGLKTHPLTPPAREGSAGADNPSSVGLRGAFDLSGRRVANPMHGLYIINGKKVHIKY
ncbi:MAG: hypothetical protein IJT75_09400 [Bacteroidaceae bacterium]|nr:hypothetical protein [Bacteroidaceae bacterium]